MPLFFVDRTFNVDTTKMNYICIVPLLKLTRVRLKLHNSIATSFLTRVEHLYLSILCTGFYIFGLKFPLQSQ